MTAKPLPTASAPIASHPAIRRRSGEFVRHVLLQDRVLRRVYPGIMHSLLFVGVTIQILGTIVNLLQYPLFLPFTIDFFPRGGAYLGFELVMDLAGLAILLGVLMAAFRRAVLRPTYLVSRWDDWLALGLLLLISVLGFLSEGIRLMSANPAWRAYSPLGTLTAMGLQGLDLAPAAMNSLHQVVFWGHVVSGLALVAVIPFTKMRHLLTGPLNILARPQLNSGELQTIENVEETEILGAGRVAEFSSPALLSFDACVQCGRCESVCPATISGMPFSPRAILFGLAGALQADLVGSNGHEPSVLVGQTFAKDTAWHCTTCGACLQACPLFVDPVSPVIEMRRYVTMTTGEVPGSVGEALTQMERRGNPWGLSKQDHAPWAKELGVRVLQPGESTDVLLFVGCAYGYEARSQKAGRDLGLLLQQAGVEFAVLGAAEGCCGETARRLGHEVLFQTMAKANIETLHGVGFNRILTACAHCYNTLRNEYPHFGGEFTVVHHTELLAELIRQGKLHPGPDSGSKTYTFHDSCYLGRYNDIYEQPRLALRSVEGLKAVEMPRRKQDGFCCGGGGGQMWMETDPNTRINQRRLDEAVQRAGAEVVVTACPYCLIMIDDAIRSKGMSESVGAVDLAEVIKEHTLG
ncbi:MAG: heterodisulfide reductase-related iron-sulfur binding cluster [Anaerolineales bacterium]|nr:heterodisulfide reductase-related iron-sulfur binding cluster [Anaerolineales bacterium]